jgi:N-acetylmuramoyl-L-alanine amidase
MRTTAGRMSRRPWLLVAVLSALSGCAAWRREPAQDALRIYSVQGWGGQPTAAPAVPQPLTRLTVHHQGEFWNLGDDVPAYLRRLQTWSRQARGWVDIPYHYIVAPDGRVYAGRPLTMAGDTNTDYDPQGHALVMLLGNFEVQEPTPEQWRSTVQLITQLLQAHGLDASALGAHRHFTAQTVCPGANLIKRFEELRRAVAAALQV